MNEDDITMRVGGGESANDVASNNSNILTNSTNNNNNGNRVQQIDSSLIGTQVGSINSNNSNTDGVDNSNLLNIRVKTMDSSEYHLEVPSSGKVNDLKQKIEERLKIPISRQRLIFQGKLLKDGTDLSLYKIQSQQVVHLVASQLEQRQNNNTNNNNINNSNTEQQQQQNQQQTNNSNNQQQQQQQQQPSQRSEFGPRPSLGAGNGLGIDLVSEIARTINESNLTRRNRRLVFQQNARQYLQTLNLNSRESQEAIRQNFWQLRSLLDTRLSYERAHEMMVQPTPANGQIQELPTFDQENRKFELGQWVDVKDTIDQWLEAQIIDIKEGQVFIHYNGWGSRWDEWIGINSPRIAAFRTYTVQNPRSNYLSPFPNISPDATNFHSPSSSNNDLSSLLGDAMKVMTQTAQMIKEFKEQRDQVASVTNMEENKEEEKKQSLEELSSLMDFDEEQKHSQQQQNRPSIGSRADSANTLNINTNANNNRFSQADQNLRVVYQAAQLAPVVDRMGRMLTDLAPHLNNIVKHHQARVRDGNMNSSVIAGGGGPSPSNIAQQNANIIGQQQQQPPPQRRSLGGLFQPLESIFNLLRSTSATQQQNQHQNNNLSISSQDLRNDSIQSSNLLGDIHATHGHHQSFIQQRPTMIQSQVPIMHSPGEISSVANIFDNRLFDDNSDSNIEFHIHAFLSPQQQQQNQQQQQQQQDQPQQPSRQNAQVGPSGIINSSSNNPNSHSSLSRHNSGGQLIRTQSQFAQQNSQSRQQSQFQASNRTTNQITQTPIDQVNKETQTNVKDTLKQFRQNKDNNKKYSNQKNVVDEKGLDQMNQEEAEDKDQEDVLTPTIQQSRLSDPLPSHSYFNAPPFFSHTLQPGNLNFSNSMNQNSLNGGGGFTLYRPVGPFGTLNDQQQQQQQHYNNSNPFESANINNNTFCGIRNSQPNSSTTLNTVRSSTQNFNQQVSSIQQQRLNTFGINSQNNNNIRNTINSNDALISEKNTTSPQMISQKQSQSSNSSNSVKRINQDQINRYPLQTPQQIQQQQLQPQQMIRASQVMPQIQNTQTPLQSNRTLNTFNNNNNNGNVSVRGSTQLQQQINNNSGMQTPIRKVSRPQFHQLTALAMNSGDKGVFKTTKKAQQSINSNQQIQQISNQIHSRQHNQLLQSQQEQDQREERESMMTMMTGESVPQQQRQISQRIMNQQEQERQKDQEQTKNESTNHFNNNNSNMIISKSNITYKKNNE